MLASFPGLSTLWLSWALLQVGVPVIWPLCGWTRAPGAGCAALPAVFWGLAATVCLGYRLWGVECMEQRAASPQLGLTCLFPSHAPPKDFEQAVLPVSHTSEEVAGQEGYNLLSVSVEIVFERKVVVASEGRRLLWGLWLNVQWSIQSVKATLPSWRLNQRRLRLAIPR